MGAEEQGTTIKSAEKKNHSQKRRQHERMNSGVLSKGENFAVTDWGFTS